MLTLEELEKRIERDTELFNNITAERESIRIRLYRYKKIVKSYEDIEELFENGDCED